tara:strand:- start:2385 stop:2504 length:120 start_codon:yes stop_codon:yes gene_type:complete
MIVIQIKNTKIKKYIITKSLKKLCILFISKNYLINKKCF